MDIKKAVIAGVIFYAIIFLIMSALMFTPIWGTDAGKVVNIAISALVLFFVAQMYYFKKKPAKPFVEGLYFGIIVTIVTIVIEIPVMVYGFAASTGWSWLVTSEMLASYVVGIIVSVLAAMTKK